MTISNLKGIFASTGTVTDPDLDPTHPSGQGGAGRDEEGWYEGKEPHQWENWNVNKADLNIVSFAERGTFTAGADVVPLNRAHSFEDATNLHKQFFNAAWTDSMLNLSLNQFNTLHQGNVLALTNHVNNVSNPHAETAIGIGSIPSTGGTFNGAVLYNLAISLQDTPTTVVDKGIFVQAAAFPAIGLGQSTAGNHLGNFVASVIPFWFKGAAQEQIHTHASLKVFEARNMAKLSVPTPIFELNFLNDVSSKTHGAQQVLYDGNSNLADGLLVEVGDTLSISGLNIMLNNGCRVYAGYTTWTPAGATLIQISTITGDDIFTAPEITVGSRVKFIRVYPPALAGLYNKGTSINSILHDSGVNR